MKASFDSNIGRILLLYLAAFGLSTHITPDTSLSTATVSQAVLSITAAPSKEELEKRQYGGTTCGFVNADPNFPVSCLAGFTCAINTHNGAGGCCLNPATCAYKSACVPYASLSNCGTACFSDAFVTKCTDLASPFCFEYSVTYPSYNGYFTVLQCEPTAGVATVLPGTTTAPNSPVVTTNINIIAAQQSPEAACNQASGQCGININGSGNIINQGPDTISTGSPPVHSNSAYSVGVERTYQKLVLWIIIVVCL